MIEKVMIQLGPKSPPTMIEKVMIQVGAKNLKSSCRMMIVHFNRNGGGGGHQRRTGDAEDAGSQGQKPNWERRGCEKPKPESRQKPQSQKPPAAAKLAMQRMRKDKAAKAA